MTTYSVLAKVTVSCWTEVEADSESEALRIASNREIAGIFMDESSEVRIPATSANCFRY